jgi:hypothetical protein
MMHDAYYFSIATLPVEAKAGITAKLQQAQVPATVKKEFERILEFMNNGASLDGKLLKIRTTDFDYKRGQNLADVEPEYAALINYTGPTDSYAAS